MKSSWIICVGLKSKNKCLYEKKTPTHGKGQSQDRDKDWSYATASQGAPEIHSKDQKLGQRYEMHSPSEGNNTANILIFGLLISRIVGE
jgi:hypothetical protein